MKKYMSYSLLFKVSVNYKQRIHNILCHFAEHDTSFVFIYIGTPLVQICFCYLVSICKKILNNLLVRANGQDMPRGYAHLEEWHNLRNWKFTSRLKHWWSHHGVGYSWQGNRRYKSVYFHLDGSRFSAKTRRDDRRHHHSLKRTPSVDTTSVSIILAK